MNEKFMKILKEQQAVQEKATQILQDTEKLKKELQNKLELLKKNC